MPPPSTPAPPRSVELPRWFAEEVLPPEAHLRSYLHRAFPMVREVHDVVQESYGRIWKARPGQPGAGARAFLFRVALALGEITLARGSGLLVLRAREIPGKSVMDVRRVTLTLLP